MTKYGIYQMFVDQDELGRDRERNLLVGFVEALSEDSAKDHFTDDEFKKGFLKAKECSDLDYKRTELLLAIEKNRKTLGVWA